MNSAFSARFTWRLGPVLHAMGKALRRVLRQHPTDDDEALRDGAILSDTRSAEATP